MSSNQPISVIQSLPSRNHFLVPFALLFHSLFLFLSYKYSHGEIYAPSSGSVRSPPVVQRSGTSFLPTSGTLTLPTFFVKPSRLICFPTDTVMHYRPNCCRQGTITFIIMIMIMIMVISALCNVCKPCICKNLNATLQTIFYLSHGVDN